MNATAPPPELVARYAETGAAPVVYDTAELTAMGVSVVEGDFAGDAIVARHHPHRLATELLRLAVKHRAERPALPAAA